MYGHLTDNIPGTCPLIEPVHLESPVTNLEYCALVPTQRYVKSSTLEIEKTKIYYSLQGYGRGLTAVKKLATKTKVSYEVAHSWLKQQAVWQIYLPAPRYIPQPLFNEVRPNSIHQFIRLTYYTYDIIS